MINEYIERQLVEWPLAKENYLKLGKTERRDLKIGDFEMFVQHNPARILSTGAKTDAASIAARPCFLCEKNRPAEQFKPELIPGWQLLVNPYPIFPVHFTIPSVNHEPQAKAPLEMVEMAEQLPGCAVFFNGAKAGASAPDHLHCQAVLKDELPLLRLVEACHPAAGKSEMKISSEFNKNLPFQFVSLVIYPDPNGMVYLASLPETYGFDSATGKQDSGLSNSFVWIDDSGVLRIVIIPRKAHRPRLYFREDESRRIISPGAVDMAGVIIAPRKEDFLSLTSEQIEEIYSDVAYADTLPDSIINNITID